MKQYIDINCDVGEGVENESELFLLISSCNIACGGHAGSKETIQTCLKLAQENNVLIGAHPSYPDKENFGRISMDISGEDLIDSIKNQMQFFLNQCDWVGASLHHIKPHGALYNDLAKDKVKAQFFLKAIDPYKNNIFLYVPYGSIVQELALLQNFKVKREAFADRNYNSDLSLVSRKMDNAVITNEREVLAHILRMFNEKRVKSIDGKETPLFADTFCIHGDTPNALQILTYITVHLNEHNIHSKA